MRFSSKNPLSAENQKVERLQNLQARHQNEYSMHEINFWQVVHTSGGLHLGALPNNEKNISDPQHLHFVNHGCS